MSYERWLQQIDTYLAMMVGVSHQDLPDQPYRDWYEDGIGAAEAAAALLEMADFPEDLLAEFQGE